MVAKSYGELHKEKVNQKVRNPRTPSLNNDMPIGYFDGASQEVGMKCGVGAILKFN